MSAKRHTTASHAKSGINDRLVRRVGAPSGSSPIFRIFPPVAEAICASEGPSAPTFLNSCG